MYVRLAYTVAYAVGLTPTVCSNYALTQQHKSAFRVTNVVMDHYWIPKRIHLQITYTNIRNLHIC